MERYGGVDGRDLGVDTVERTVDTAKRCVDPVEPCVGVFVFVDLLKHGRALCGHSGALAGAIYVCITSTWESICNYINITYIQLQSRTYKQFCIQRLQITGICESFFIHSMNIVTNSTVNT